MILSWLNLQMWWVGSPTVLKSPPIKNIPLFTSASPSSTVLSSYYPPTSLRVVSTCDLQSLTVRLPSSPGSSGFCLLNSPETSPTEAICSSLCPVTVLQPSSSLTSLLYAKQLTASFFKMPLLLQSLSQDTFSLVLPSFLHHSFSDPFIDSPSLTPQRLLFSRTQFLLLPVLPG